MAVYKDQIESRIRDDEKSNESSLPSTPFKRFSNENSPIDLRIKGCTSNPCVLYAGSILTAEWDFLVGKFFQIIYILFFRVFAK